MLRRAVSVVLFAWLTGCASYTTLAPADRATLEGELTGDGRTWFLRLSYYVTPFFGDASKKLLTAVPPNQVRLLEEPGGGDINPGNVEKILPVGTRVRVTRVEFPTSWAVTERVLYTPRTQPWLYVSAEGQSDRQPLILVLRPKIKSQEEFRAEVERYLSVSDPSLRMTGWSDGVRDAVRNKTAVTDMPADALEMAWGYPERKQITFEESVRKETWIYPDRLRVAHLEDGRLRSTEGE